VNVKKMFWIFIAVTYTFLIIAAIVKVKSEIMVAFVYDSSASRLIIPKTPWLSIDISQIVLIDEYLDSRYTFALPGDYGGYFGEGVYAIEDDYIGRVAVFTENGRTYIRFFQQRVMAYVVTEDEENIYFQAMLPRDKYPRIVIIDPGHGGYDDLGAVANDLVEKEINLDISLRLAQLLESNDIKAYLTRTSDVGLSLEGRAEFANGLGDLFISIHNNAAYRAGAHGTETFFVSGEDYGETDLRNSRAAQIIHRNVIEALGSLDRRTWERRFRVLVLTEMPAALVEFGFITNLDEAAKLGTEAYRQKCAEGVLRGVLEIFEEYTPHRSGSDIKVLSAS